DLPQRRRGARMWPPAAAVPRRMLAGRGGSTRHRQGRGSERRPHGKCPLLPDDREDHDRLSPRFVPFLTVLAPPAGPGLPRARPCGQLSPVTLSAALRLPAHVF